MYFASDADRLVRDAIALLNAVKDGAVVVPDEDIAAGFSSCRMETSEQIQIVQRNLKRRRVDLGWSVDDVARQTGLSRSAVY